MADMVPWCICCGRTKAICKRDKGCSKVDPTERTSYFEPYYYGGYRIVRDGVPCRVSAVVATLRNKDKLFRPMSAKDHAAISIEMRLV